MESDVPGSSFEDTHCKRSDAGGSDGHEVQVVSIFIRSLDPHLLQQQEVLLYCRARAYDRPLVRQRYGQNPAAFS